MKSWFIGDWQECSGTCTNGRFGLMKRSIVCIKQKPNELNDELELIGMPDNACNLKKRPKSVKRCHVNFDSCKNDTNHYWIALEWTKVFIQISIELI